MQNQRLTTFAALVVLVIWATTIVDGMLTGGYEGAQIATPIMVILAGYLFGKEILSARRKGGGE